MDRFLNMTELNRIYYDARQPDSYGGINALQRASRGRKTTVEKWLQSQDVYTLHRTPRRNFQRRKTIVYGENSQYQLDLIDASKISQQNDGNKFIFTAIDVFSKYAFAIPIKNKKATSCVNAFSKILSEKPIKSVSFDRGSEFYNRKFLGLLKKENIHHFSSFNYVQKASVIERWNQTLLRKLYKIFTYAGSNRFIEVLPDVVYSYNNAKHRSTRFAPVDVNSSNREDVWYNLYERNAKPNKPPKFPVGSKVRISRLTGLFQKSYLATFSEELFVVDKAVESDPPFYYLKDLKGEVIKGCFYEPELQLVNKLDNVYLIEKVIKTRRRRKKMQYLVRWLGYHETFDSWIDKSDFQKYIN